jgi:hypothetical protein
MGTDAGKRMAGEVERGRERERRRARAWEGGFPRDRLVLAMFVMEWEWSRALFRSGKWRRRP